MDSKTSCYGDNPDECPSYAADKYMNDGLENRT